MLIDSVGVVVIFKYACQTACNWKFYRYILQKNHPKNKMQGAWS